MADRTEADCRTRQPLGSLVTYSAAYTLVPTYECFNRCQYCNFRVEPGADRWLGLAEATVKLRSLTNPLRDCYKPQSGQFPIAPTSPPSSGPIEILILSGEVHPRSPRRSAWIRRIESLCRLALLEGFLPHANVGPLDREEMAYLKAVNVSMGLMIEQVSPALAQTVHRHAPSKDPSRRLAQLAQAGELQIPFTTGLLIGIGETEADRLDSLRAIGQIHRQYGHIQEVIVQPHSPGRDQVWGGEACSAALLLETVAIARELLPPEIAIQVPPNLLKTAELLQRAIELGASDLGGICPIDEVNPTYEHPSLAQLTGWVAAAGGQLRPRLPIYPAFDDWLSDPMRSLVQSWRDFLGSSPDSRDFPERFDPKPGPTMQKLISRP